VQELMAVSDIEISERAGAEVRSQETVDLTVLERRPSELVVVADDADNRDADDLEEEDDVADGLVEGSVEGGTLADAGSDVLPPELSWQERALCAQTDPEAFFPEKGGSTREAKRVCMSCEVRAECLDYALAKDERFGIWGGLSERERRRVKTQAV
jgi:WhiB family redox-sensing transcriptional regulator